MHFYDDSFLEEMSAQVLEYMGISDCAISFVSHDELNKKANTKVVNYGYYVNQTKSVVLNKNAEILVIFSFMFHELMNYKQYQTGKLVDVMTKSGYLSHFLFEGEYFEYDYPYEDRPWEKEAIEMQHSLFMKFISDSKNSVFTKKLMGVHTKKGI